MGEVRIGPTNNRSVVGVMNELAFSGERHWRSGVDDLEELSVRMASFRLGPLDALGGSPDRALAAVLRTDSSNSLPHSPSVISAPAVARPTGVARVYQLRVTLLGTKLAVWRRVLVDGAATLADVHEVIQAAFGWWNYHLYEFEIGRTRYGIPDPDRDFGPKAHDARRTRLEEVAQTGSSFRYTYDFGDGWEHRVEVEDAAPATPAVTVPGCIDGRRACPPEDCGGPWGYQELLSILADPSHPEHEERRQWVDDEWGGVTLDPEAFDPTDFADNLRNVRRAAFED